MVRTTAGGGGGGGTDDGSDGGGDDGGAGDGGTEFQTEENRPTQVPDTGVDTSPTTTDTQTEDNRPTQVDDTGDGDTGTSGDGGAEFQTEDNRPTRVPDTGVDTSPTATDTFQTEQNRPSRTDPDPGPQLTDTGVEDRHFVGRGGGGQTVDVAQEYESQFTSRPGVDSDDVRIDLFERPGGERFFSPAFSRDFRRGEAAQMATAAFASSPFGPTGTVLPGDVQTQENRPTGTPLDNQVTPGEINLTAEGPEVSEQEQAEQAADRLSQRTGIDVSPSEVEQTESGGYTVDEGVQEAIAAEQLGVDPQYIDYNPDAGQSTDGDVAIGSGFTIDRGFLDAIATTGTSEDMSGQLGSLAAAYGEDAAEPSPGGDVSVPHPLTQDFRQTTAAGATQSTQAFVQAGEEIGSEIGESVDETAEEGQGFFEGIAAALDRSDTDIESNIEDARESDFWGTTQEGMGETVPDLPAAFDRSDTDIQANIEDARERDFGATTGEGATATAEAASGTVDLSFLDRSDTDLEANIQDARERDFGETTREGREATVDAALGPVDSLAAGFGPRTEEDVQDIRREAFPEITAELEAGLEEETGVELDPEDVNIEFEDGQAVGSLSPSGESDVAAERAPLSGVPVVGDVLAQGARYRVGMQQTFGPASDAFRETTPDVEDVGTLLAVGAPAAAAEPTPVGEVGLGTAAVGIGTLAGSAAVIDTALGDPPEAETDVQTAESDVTLNLSGTADPFEQQEQPQAEFGEIPAPTETPEEPFPAEIPAPTRPASEPFPTEQDAPTEAPSEPFPEDVPEGETPEEPSDPFPADAPEPEDPQQPFPEDTPPIDAGVGETVGGPAAFASPVGQGVIGSEILEEEEQTRGVIGREDLFRGTLPQPGEPGYPSIRDRTVEGQRVRVFPGEETVSPRERYEERVERMREEAAETATQTPAQLTGVIAAQRQDQRLEPLAISDTALDEAQLQVPQLSQTPQLAEIQRIGEPTRIYEPLRPGYPNEPTYPNEPRLGTPYITTNVPTPRTPRPRLPFDLPEQDDREPEDPDLEGVAAPIITSFRDPITGELIETDDESDFQPLI